MNSRDILHASFAALLPLLSLQACAVDDEDLLDDSDVVASEIVEEDDCEIGATRWCEQDEDPTVEGRSTCIEEDDGITGWIACAPRPMNGPEDCYVEEIWDGNRCVWDVGSTPIVLRFGADEVAYTSAAGADFDLTGVGYSVATDWPTAATPWLAFDRDGDGRITSGAELFGSATPLAAGGVARHGFEALTELDTNGDGVVDAADPAFGRLVVWADANADRVSQPGEMVSLAARGITSLSVAARVRPVCDDRGNCGRERAAFTFVGADGVATMGEAVDVYLPWR